MKKMRLFAGFLAFLLLAGCGSADSSPESLYTSSRIFLDDNACYIGVPSDPPIVNVLDYETMTMAPLCNKPNCPHTDANCDARIYGGNAPLIIDNVAYYFVDGGSTIETNEEGKTDLKLETSLFQYDFSTATRKELTTIDNVFATNSESGYLYLDGSIWFIGSWLGRSYDDEGNFVSNRSSGGKAELYSVDLSTLEVTNHGDIWDMDELVKYHPMADHSAQFSLEGLFDNKIYIGVTVIDLALDPDILDQLGIESDIERPKEDTPYSYVEYYDLETGTFGGAPNYSDIQYQTVTFLSEDYLVLGEAADYPLGKEGSLSVWTPDAKEAIIFTGEEFNEGTLHTAYTSIFDDKLFFHNNVYDLKTQECQTLTGRETTEVIDEYDDNYIVSYEDENYQTRYDKIPKSEYLAG